MKSGAALIATGHCISGKAEARQYGERLALVKQRRGYVLIP